MYEGPIRAIGRAADEEAPILRHLRWTDLVARIAATREQRGGAGEAHGDQLGSFASLHLGQVEEGIRSVNHDALNRGKTSPVFPPEAANNAGDGDRETK
jgi:hypothetical protein